MKRYLLLALIATAISCQHIERKKANVTTTDIDNFWKAYDQVIQESDSLRQTELIDSLYIQKGSVGLNTMMEVRNYSAQEYVTLINHYPKYWASLRSNTLKAHELAGELNNGISKLEAIYPELKPAKIYFTVGCMRTNGTTRDSMVLIGSELAMTDSLTDISEFDGETKDWLINYFNTNPIHDLVLLNIHEYVHTQQKEQVHNLLSIALREGVAEFVSTLALNKPSAVDAIAFGKENAAAVRERFEQEMFYPNNQPKWFWSNYPNEFGVRDLGYYVGYQMCENYYQQTEDKTDAIRTMIELDFTDETEVESFIQQSHYFSAPLDTLYQRFERSRPYVTGIKQFENNSQQVNPKTTEITVEFSQPLNGHNTGVDFGELGEAYFPKNDVSKRFWSDDNTAWTISVALEPYKRYQLLISNNFRTSEDVPLRPYLIDFTTGN